MKYLTVSGGDTPRHVFQHILRGFYGPILKTFCKYPWNSFLQRIACHSLNFKRQVRIKALENRNERRKISPNFFSALDLFA